MNIPLQTKPLERSNQAMERTPKAFASRLAGSFGSLSSMNGANGMSDIARWVGIATREECLAVERCDSRDTTERIGRGGERDSALTSLTRRNFLESGWIYCACWVIPCFSAQSQSVANSTAGGLSLRPKSVRCSVSIFPNVIPSAPARCGSAPRSSKASASA